jgi:hypothetical protein
MKNEFLKYDEIIKEKFFSNNAYFVYEETILKSFIENIYKQEQANIPFTPSFTRILNVNKIDEPIIKDIDKKLLPTVLFMLKKIYYHDFLNNKEAINLKIKESVKDMHEKRIEQSEQEHLESWNSFFKIICTENNLDLENVDYKNFDFEKVKIDFETLCQQVQRDYADANSEKNKGKGMHYNIILRKLVKDAFISYVKADKDYDFIFTPEENEAQKQKDIKNFITPDIKAKLPFFVDASKWYIYSAKL